MSCSRSFVLLSSCPLRMRSCEYNCRVIIYNPLCSILTKAAWVVKVEPVLGGPCWRAWTAADVWGSALCGTPLPLPQSG